MNYDVPQDDSFLNDEDEEIVYEAMCDTYNTIIDGLTPLERAAFTQDYITFARLYRQMIKESQYE